VTLDLHAYLDSLASAEPTPGGGSGSALVAQTGAALVAMVARIALLNAKLAMHHDAAREIVRRADALRAKLELARAGDESAYAAVVRAMQLPRATSDERSSRTATLQDALGAAAEPPLAIAESAALVVRLAERALALENTNLTSDLGCAAEFGAAGLRAAAYNVQANHRYMKDRGRTRAQAARLAKAESDVTAPLARVRFETSRALAP